MKSTTLGGICDRADGAIQTGPFGSQLHQSDYRSDGVPVIMPQDIVGNRISTEKIAYIDEAMARRLGRHLLSNGDIVFPRRGEINKRAIIGAEQEGYFCGTGCLKISVPPVEVLPQWLFYYLGMEHIVKWIESKAIGATMLNLNTGILRAVPIEYPSMGAQQRVVDCLSAYDELVATNQRRIQLLEKAAQLFYREWFVHLRFPGHESVPVREGVPEGWKVDRLDSAFTLQRGFDLPAAERVDGDTPIIASTGICGTHNVSKVAGPGVVTGRSGTLGEVHFIPGDFWPLNTTLWVKEFKQVTPVIAYFILKNLNLASLNAGASVPSLDRKTVHPIQIVIPSAQVQQAFDEIVNPIFAQMDQLTELNNALCGARDLLLPKLMSGQLDVSRISLPEEVAA